MNFQTAGIGALVGFVLSFLVALVSGIPLLDVFLRALLWGVVFGGATLGAEALLRSQLPDLFEPAAPATEEQQAASSLGESVNIVLDDESMPAPFVEEIHEQSADDAPQELPPAFIPATPGMAAAAPASAPSGEEPLQEIGSFLNSFRPQAEGDEGGEEVAAGGQSPGIEEYVPESGGSGPSEPSSVYAPSRGADLEGMEQDPAILAKAVKSVMNKT
ncbi:MAG: hypothetical protein WCG80_07490 [Spirochaetales bacterium]